MGRLRREYRLLAKVLPSRGLTWELPETRGAIASCSSTKATICATARGSATARFRNTSCATRASAFCFQPRRTTRPTWTCRASFGCSCAGGQDIWRPPGTADRGNLGKPSSSAATSAQVRSLAAFEKSEYADDWRELMRLYMVRRTRSFIQDNYARPNPANGRKFLTFEGRHAVLLPERVPKTVKFRDRRPRPCRSSTRGSTPPDIVGTINALTLPPLWSWQLHPATAKPKTPPTPSKTKVSTDLSRAGKRLMGFCRTNLFKRLESSGSAFLLSIERHILRNFIVLHAIENGLDIPLGTQDSELLDTRYYDEDAEDGDGRMSMTTTTMTRKSAR